MREWQQKPNSSRVARELTTVSSHLIIIMSLFTSLNIEQYILKTFVSVPILPYFMKIFVSVPIIPFSMKIFLFYQLL